MVAFGFLTLLLLSVGYASALKYDFSSSDSGTYSKVIAQSFGMAASGIIDVEYSVTEYTPTPYVLLLIVTESQRLGWYTSVGDGGNTNSLCSQPSLYRKVIQGTGNFTFSTSTVDRYSVLVLQCIPSPANTIKTTINVSAKNKRVDDDANYSYLPIEDVTLIRLFQGEVLMYVLLLLGLMGQYYFGRNWTKQIHGLFAATLVFGIADSSGFYSLFVKANDQGTFPHSLTIFVNLLSHFFLFSSLASLLMLCLGWSTLRTFISPKEKQAIHLALGCFFFAGFANSFCLSSSSVCGALSLATYVFRCVLYLGIIIALNFTVTQLRIMLLHSPWVASLSVQYARLKQFQMFRIVFVIYLLLPTFFLLLQTTLLSWKEEWLVVALSDLLDMFLILHVGVTFGPMNEISITRAFSTFNNAGPDVAL